MMLESLRIMLLEFNSYGVGITFSNCPIWHSSFAIMETTAGDIQSPICPLNSPACQNSVLEFFLFIHCSFLLFNRQTMRLPEFVLIFHLLKSGGHIEIKVQWYNHRFACACCVFDGIELHL